MMAAISASQNSSEGCSVILLEKNEKLGKKLYITGKGRCNFTNACDMPDFFNSVVSNPKFLYSALYTFDNNAAIDFVESHGIATKIERGGRVFPLSDHASDITKALQAGLRESGVSVRLNTRVDRLIISYGSVTGVELGDRSCLETDRVIIATGGLSYPSTGSTGDGIRFARDAGIDIAGTSPALVPLETLESDIYKMQGLSLKNVSLKIKNDAGKVLFDQFGEMLFTHFGVSGPLVLSASSYLAKGLRDGRSFSTSIDLKPAISEEELDQRLIREIDDKKNKQFKNFFDGILPQKMIPVFLERLDIEPAMQNSFITKEMRHKILKLIKNFEFTITAARGYNEAIITQGGVSVREVNPSTMETRKVKGLYFAGEVLDVDALTGGFNIQIALSTGYLAGISAAIDD